MAEAEAAQALTECVCVAASQTEEVNLSAEHSASWTFDPSASPVGDWTDLGGGDVVSFGVEDVDPARVTVSAGSASTEGWDLIVVGATAEGAVEQPSSLLGIASPAMPVHCPVAATFGAGGGDATKGEHRGSRVIGDVGVKGWALGLRVFGLRVVVRSDRLDFWGVVTLVWSGGVLVVIV